MCIGKRFWYNLKFVLKVKSMDAMLMLAIYIRRTKE